VTILEAGRATLELADPSHAAYIDEVEVGRRVAGYIRVAFEVGDTVAAMSALEAAGAAVIAEPTPTPWESLNARLEGPAGLQLTLFCDLPARRAPWPTHQGRPPRPHPPRTGPDAQATGHGRPRIALRDSVTQRDDQRRPPRSIQQPGRRCP
jgi:hypothetical protein